MNALTRLFVFTLAWGSCTFPAYAGWFDLFGVGSRNIAMGQASTASVKGPSAMFYNPAQLVQSHEIAVDLWTSASLFDLSIEDRSQNHWHWNAGMGLVIPLEGVENIALGMLLEMPLDRLLSIEAPDPESQYWYLYQSLPQKLHLILGSAWAPYSWISMGLGVQILADLDGQVDLNIDLIQSKMTHREVHLALEQRISPVLGLSLGPWKWSPWTWSMGFEYRAPLELHYRLPLYFDFGGETQIEVQVEGQDLYTPHVLRWGQNLSWSTHRWTLDLEYALWSLAPSPSLDVDIAVTGALPSGLGVAQALDFPSPRPPAPSFKNQWSVHLGWEENLGQGYSLLGGYFWRDAVMNDAQWPAYALDSQAHVASIGAMKTWQNAQLGMAFQWTWHPEHRTVLHDYEGSLYLLSMDWHQKF